MCKYIVNVLISMVNGKEIGFDLNVNYKPYDLDGKELNQDDNIVQEKIRKQIIIDYGLKLRNAQTLDINNIVLITNNIAYVEVRDIKKV